MKLRVLQIIVLMGFICTVPAVLHTQQPAQTVIDVDVTMGRKPLPRFENSSSSLQYSLGAGSLRSHFSGWQEIKKEQETRTLLIKFTRNNESYEFSDADANGKFELLRYYKDALLYEESKLHEDKNLISEQTLFDQFGAIREVNLDLKANGYFGERNIYENGQIRKTLKDKNGDGLFETEIYYAADDQQIVTRPSMPLPDNSGLPVNLSFTIIGFSNRDANLEFMPAETSELISALSGYTMTSSSQAREYHKAAINDNQNENLLLRFPIYTGIAKVNNQSVFTGYALTAEVSTEGSTRRVLFRAFGPTPLQQTISGEISLSTSEYSAPRVAREVADYLLSRIHAKTGTNPSTP
ncbi:MAG: hypothetical protein KDK38_09680 [Leptospiraceae bacterium]|nr:hypothetical protein [Leptospiraceae bacterium]